ncbi:MAG: hypothetical protein Q9161_009612 [Pseudevernia consocians]
MSGKIHLAIDRAHQRYDIYGHQPAGKPAVVKSEFYEMYGAGFRSLCIGSERNPSKHQQMRRLLSSAFSTRALLEQESIVASNIDTFVMKMGLLGGPKTNGLNMSKWYEMSAFDILGDMAFGESFHCIDNADSKEQERYTKLREEVRKHFSTYESINATAAQQLPYLQAVIDEGLRIYPPGSQGFPRISPGIFVDGYWVPKGVGS